MIDKGEIIKTALRKLGKVNIYNDNKSEEYRVALESLELIIKNIAKRTTFLFNSTTTKLTSIGKNNLGEHRFNIPIDCLNVIRGSEEYRIEGEFLYSPSSEINIQYCRDIDFSEYPDNLFDYLVACVCVEMCMSFNSFEDRYQAFKQEEYKERNTIINQQNFNFEPWG